MRGWFASDELEHALLRHFLHPVGTAAGLEARMQPDLGWFPRLLLPRSAPLLRRSVSPSSAARDVSSRKETHLWERRQGFVLGPGSWGRMTSSRQQPVVLSPWTHLHLPSYLLLMARNNMHVTFGACEFISISLLSFDFLISMVDLHTGSARLWCTSAAGYDYFKLLHPAVLTRRHRFGDTK